MRLWLVLICVLALPSGAAAICFETHKLDVWPAAGTALAPNGRIHLLIGRGASTVQEVLARHRPVLVRGDERVRLKIESVEEPYRIGTAVVLAPERWLRPEAEYTLALEGLTPESVAQLDARENWPAAGHPAPRWRTTHAPDWKPPVWSARPVVWPGSSQRAGCGPVVGMPVVTPVADDRPGVHIRATVKPAGGSPGRGEDEAPRTLHIGITDLGIDLGHGMCGGAFALEPRRRYRVWLEAVDAAGNRTPAPGGPLEIEWPESAEDRMARTNPGGVMVRVR